MNWKRKQELLAYFLNNNWELIIICLLWNSFALILNLFITMLKCNCLMTVWLNIFCLHEAWLMLTESKIIRKTWLLKNLLSSQCYWRRMNITDCGSCVKSRTEKGFFLHQWLGDLYTWLSLTLMGVICLIFYEPDVKLMAVFPLSLVGCGSATKCTNEFGWNIGAYRLRISTYFIHSYNKKCGVNA